MFRCPSCGEFNRIPERHPEGVPRCSDCEAALDLSGVPQDVTTQGLARAVASAPVPVLADFWAPWCAPCHAAAPVLEALGGAYAGELVVLKVDIQAEPQAAASHGIRGVPTFLVFRGGKEAGRRSGLLPKGELERWVFGVPGPAPHAVL